MERVSSVTAFLFRYLSGSETNAEAQEILESLTPVERRIVCLVATADPQQDRLHQLAGETGEAWSPERHRRAEGLALNRLRQELVKRNLLQP